MFRSVQSRDEQSSSASVEIAPLIDIVFILLIFFLVTATFVRDTGVQVSRPEATVTHTLEPTSMRVSVTAAGAVYTDGHRVSLEELRLKVSAFIARERQRAVIVIPDVEVPAGRLMEVMDAARLGGATDVALATRQKGGR
jgi:biopolymer transport protein ExbD